MEVRRSECIAERFGKGADMNCTASILQCSIVAGMAWRWRGRTSLPNKYNLQFTEIYSAPTTPAPTFSAHNNSAPWNRTTNQFRQLTASIRWQTNTCSTRSLVHPSCVPCTHIRFVPSQFPKYFINNNHGMLTGDIRCNCEWRTTEQRHANENDGILWDDVQCRYGEGERDSWWGPGKYFHIWKWRVGYNIRQNEQKEWQCTTHLSRRQYITVGTNEELVSCCSDAPVNQPQLEAYNVLLQVSCVCMCCDCLQHWRSLHHHHSDDDEWIHCECRRQASECWTNTIFHYISWVVTKDKKKCSTKGTDEHLFVRFLDVVTHAHTDADA